MVRIVQYCDIHVVCVFSSMQSDQLLLVDM